MNLRERVAWALNETSDTNEPLSNALGVHKNTIAAYKKCSGELKSVVLEGLVREYHFSPIWLLTGKGDVYAPHDGDEKGYGNDKLDVDLLESVIEWLENYLQTNSKSLQPNKKARFILFAYQYFCDTGKDVTDGEMENYLRLVA